MKKQKMIEEKKFNYIVSWKNINAQNVWQ